MKRVLLWMFTLTTLSALGQSNQSIMNNSNKVPEGSEEIIIKEVIEKFLSDIGSYNIDSLPTMFADNANISGSSLNEGLWSSYTMTIEEFLTTLRSSTNPAKYSEPVNNWTILIEGGRLAFVRADATLIKIGNAPRHNIDYFTLIKDNNQWKILNGSYVSQPM